MINGQKKLERLPLFEGLSADEYLLLTSNLMEEHFHAGEVILSQGSEGRDLYIIITGAVSVEVILPGDKTKSAATLSVGQVFGEVAFLGNALITANIVAKGRVKCLILFKRVLNMMRMAYPETAFKIERAIANQTNSKIIENLKRILNFFKAIPEEYRTESEHALYLPNADAKCTHFANWTVDYERLKKLSFFQPFSTQELKILMQLLDVKVYDKGYRFGEKDKPIKKVSIIYSGAVMLFIKEDNKLIKSIAVSGVGDIFMQNFLYPEFNTCANYVSCEPCVILELGFENYGNLHDVFPAIFYFISQHIHQTIVGLLYIINRQFVRINCEYRDII